MTLTIRLRLVDGGPRPWAGLSWATPRTSSRSGRLRIGCRACCSCRFRRRRQARTDSILTSVRSIKPQKSNVSFPSVLGGPMSGSVTRRGWYSPTLKAMSSASFGDEFGPIPRSQPHRTTLRSLAGRRGSSRHRRLIRRSRLDRQSRVIGPRDRSVRQHLVAVPRSITMSAAVGLELRRCDGPIRSMSRFAESSVVSAAWVRTVLGRRPSGCAPLRSSAPCASPPTSAWGSRSSTACRRP